MHQEAPRREHEPIGRRMGENVRDEKEMGGGHVDGGNASGGTF